MPQDAAADSEEAAAAAFAAHWAGAADDVPPLPELVDADSLPPPCPAPSAAATPRSAPLRKGFLNAPRAARPVLQQPALVTQS